MSFALIAVLVAWLVRRRPDAAPHGPNFAI
jgi:hypothetical protein